SATVTITAAAATHVVIDAPASATAGDAVNLTVTALDAYGNIDTAYSGTIHFTSSDSQAGLPADATLTAGTGAFTATFTNAGSQTIAATDLGDPTISGAATISVAPISTTLAMTVPDAIFGDNALVTVTVSTDSATPRGEVSLIVDGIEQLTHELANGSWTF